jgi:hypothetical protein
LIAVTGGILFFATKYKVIARLFLAGGLALTLLTLLLIVLAVNSGM